VWYNFGAPKLNTLVSKNLANKSIHFLNKNCGEKTTVASSNQLQKSPVYAKIIEGVLAQNLRGKFLIKNPFWSRVFPDYRGKPLINIYSHYLIIFDNKIHINIIHHNPNTIITFGKGILSIRVFSFHILIYNYIIHFILHYNIVQ
jgi:hypothetical protein